MNILYRLLRCAMVLMAMMPLMVHGQITPTTDTDGNGIIDDNEKNLYLIQSYCNEAFYMRDNSRNNTPSKVNTSNIVTANSEWYFLDGGTFNDIQYYYIVHNATNKYVYLSSEGENTEPQLKDAPTSGQEDYYRFKFVLNSTRSAYNILVKLNDNTHSLNKNKGNSQLDNIRQFSVDNDNSCWNFIAKADYTKTTCPFDLSTLDGEKHYYNIQNNREQTLYMNQGSTYVVSDNTFADENDRVWYFVKATEEDYLDYYYIVHPKTGKYLRYKGNNGDAVADAVQLSNLDLSEQNKFLFIIVPGSRDDETHASTISSSSYCIAPKIPMVYRVENTVSICTKNDTQGTNNGQNLRTFKERNGNDHTHWNFIPTVYNTACIPPTITYSSETGKITIATNTADAEIHYTTDGVTDPSSSVGTLYSGPFDVSAPVTIKAIATKTGYPDSGVTTLFFDQVATPSFELTNDGKVRLTCTTDGVDFYYEMGVNPNNPTTSSTHYVNPIENAAGQYIKAIAVKDGMINSAVATSAQITLSCATPVIRKTSATTFTITCSFPTSGVTIYYNIGDGTQAAPTNTTGTLYQGEVTFDPDNLPFTVKAIAYATDYSNSDVATKYIQGNDYSQNYLTFNVLTSGEIPWKSIGSGMAKEISYRINGGSWTPITAGNNVTISVVAGDVVEFKGSNSTYAKDKSNYSGFDGGTATYNISGNIMSLIYGDNFVGETTMSGSYNFCSLFKQSKAVSAENLILPATSLTECCYRAMFSKCTTLEVAPALPATTLGAYCYYYMFEECAITSAPELPAPTLASNCYGNMFTGCTSLNHILCLAVDKSASGCLTNWVNSVSPTGTFVKDVNATWTTGSSGIPFGWGVSNHLAAPDDPVITCDGEYITITCQTYGASIYYRLGQTGSYSLYSAPIEIHENTVVEAYAVKGELQSNTVSENCIATKTYKFAGMEITPGPLYYGSNGYEIKEGWNYDSYNSIYGKTAGSTYFNFIELGQLFESSVFSTSDGDIEKVLDPLDGWRVPTNAEWASILGTTRSGSTVNGSSNRHYAMIQLADVSGLLIFPDGATITGVALSNMDNAASNTGITESQLDDYLIQGCIFLPGSGYYDGSWGNGHYYWSSTEKDSSTGYVSSGDNKDKESSYLPVYLVKDAADEATRLLKIWTYNNKEVELPYSINAIDGHSASYAKGTFTFTTDVKIKESQPTYLWFQHADQSAAVYVDNTLVEKHWGGYNAFFVDITDYVHSGTNNIKVAVKNNEGNHLAPCAGDFNFNATLGEVKLISSPVVPDPDYGYDGFHITSTVTSASATITVKTSVPTSATITCSIKGTNCNYSETQTGTGEIEFTTTINNPHLWNGTLDPYLYDVTLTIAKDGVVYHEFKRGYGLRFFEYVVDNNTPENSRFMLNGSPYLLRGVCMHHDLEGKANALTAADIDNDFEILKELGCNFVRLAHYPHPKEVYDWCDKMGLIVQTEVPWVNRGESTLPNDYYTHLEGQYRDMVNQHYNHPSILFWGLSNETTTDNKDFANEKINGYIALIKNLDSSRWVGYVMSHSVDDPSGYYNDPDADWFGCNIYVGWYIDKTSNNPTGRLNTRLSKTLNRLSRPLAFSEYGCGGTQSCHSDDFMNTTTSGNNPRHDIEYQMWLHEGHIAAIKNFPQLLFTSQWQLFDIAVSNRQEGYKVCKDGETVFDYNELKRLNNKGLVERDHKTKKDPFYLYKAWWNQTDKFVHICGKDYKDLTNRAIKCYTNDGSTLKLYVNDVEIETATVENNIATFTARNFNPGDVVKVIGETSNDTFTFTDYNVFTTEGNWDEASNWSANAVPTVSSDVDIVANATVPSGCTANVGNVSLYGTTLTIADGGQLVSNSAVNATVEKNITAYTISQNEGESLTNGWYFIASPITDDYTPTGSMVENTYDLYRLNNTTWENYKQSGDHYHFNLESGRGYLYANSEDVTLQFTGTLKPYAASESVSVSTGWNLIGNPFAYDVYANRSFYRINEANTGVDAVSAFRTSPIAPCTGIVVEAETDGNVIFSKEIPSQSQGSNGSLQITLSQANTRNNVLLDKAIVSFNEGDQLSKFYFGTQNANIYIPQGAEEYAIVSVESQGEIPVNFKAHENGEYTLTISATLNFTYLHLIDKMTGADVDLLQTPEYAFDAKTTDYESRFKLVFNASQDPSGDFAFIHNGEIIINGSGTLQVIDIMGRTIVTRRDGACTVSTEGMAPGVYVLHLIQGDSVRMQKIVIP